MSAAGGGYYERLHLRLLAEGLSAREAMAEVAEAYLDGRPEKVNGHKMSRSGQDNLFWTTACVKVADAQDWEGEAMGLALTRYLAQDKIAAPGLLDVLAQQAPVVLTDAVRHSGLVLRPDSPRHHELQQAAAHAPDVAELCRVLHIFEEAHALRRDELVRCQSPFSRMSVVELLAWASLYAFEHLVPHDLHGQAPLEAGGTPVTSAWDAINELLLWKLRTGDRRSASGRERHCRASWTVVQGLALFDGAAAGVVGSTPRGISSAHGGADRDAGIHEPQHRCFLLG